MKKITSDTRMIRSIMLDIRTDEEADKLIKYIKEKKNPTIQDINWESVRITASRTGIKL